MKSFLFNLNQFVRLQRVQCSVLYKCCRDEQFSYECSSWKDYCDTTTQ
jgi:hypothetical protein